jgi:hypothetical protein
MILQQKIRKIKNQGSNSKMDACEIGHVRPISRHNKMIRSCLPSSTKTKVLHVPERSRASLRKQGSMELIFNITLNILKFKLI